MSVDLEMDIGNREIYDHLKIKKAHETLSLSMRILHDYDCQTGQNLTNDDAVHNWLK